MEIQKSGIYLDLYNFNIYNFYLGDYSVDIDDKFDGECGVLQAKKKVLPNEKIKIKYISKFDEKSMYGSCDIISSLIGGNPGSMITDSKRMKKFYEKYMARYIWQIYDESTLFFNYNEEIKKTNEEKSEDDIIKEKMTILIQECKKLHKDVMDNNLKKFIRIDNNLKDIVITEKNDSKEISQKKEEDEEIILSQISEMYSSQNKNLLYFEKDVLKLYNEEYTKNISTQEKEEILLHYQGLVYKLDYDDNKKYVIFGDYHGSYHSFYRNLIRLSKKGIVDMEKLTIADNYVLIFLGDVMDRGNFCVEMMATLMTLIINNNNGSDINQWKIFINRGNHECVDQMFMCGSLIEMYKKNLVSKSFSDNYNLNERAKNRVKILYEKNENKGNKILADTYGGTYLSIMILYDIVEQNEKNVMYDLCTLFSYMPSAILLKKKNKNDDINIWLSHGGIPVLIHNKLLIGSLNVNNFTESVTHTDIEFGNRMRWCNVGKQYAFDSSRPFIPGDKYLESNINFAIRGHQDTMISSALLGKSDISKAHDSQKNDYTIRYNTSYKYEPFWYLPLIKLKGPNIEYSDEYYNDSNNSKKYMCRFNIPVDREPLKFKANDDNNYEAYPVLTISTNNSVERNIPSDSFVILHSVESFVLQSKK